MISVFLHIIEIPLLLISFINSSLSGMRSVRGSKYCLKIARSAGISSKIAFFTHFDGKIESANVPQRLIRRNILLGKPND